MNKLAVVGGGVSGLSALYTLSRKYKQNSVHILEKEDQLGGRIRIEMHNDYFIDTGAQFLTESDNEAFRLLNALNIKKDLVPLNMSFSVFDGEKLFPASLTGLLKSTSGEEKVELMKLFTRVKKEKKKFSEVNAHDVDSEYTKKTFAEWYEENVGDQMLWLFDSIIRSISFVDSSRLSALYGLTIIDALLDQCYSFRDGLSRITEEIIRQSKNINIKTSTKVDRVEESGDGEFLVNGEKFSKVVLSVPYPEAKRIYPKLKGDIQYSSCYYVVAGFKKRLWDKDWALFMPKNSSISFISEETLKFGRTKSDSGVMGFILPTEKEMSDNEILRVILNELTKMFDVSEEDVLEMKSFYWDYALPICSTEFHKTLNNIKKMDHGGLYLCGDYMSLPSLDGAIESGRLAAEKLVKEG